MRLWPTRHTVVLHDIALLVASGPALQSLARQSGASLRSQVFTLAQHEHILQLHLAMGHRMTAARLQQRFANGLQFLAFWAGDCLLGSTWVALGGGRYVDELNWYLPIKPGECWLRDLFVLPAQRGRGLLAQFVGQLVHEHLPNATAVWSDVDWVNRASMRAHQKAGFTVYARVRALDLAQRLRVRSGLPAWHLPVAEIDPSRRWLLLTSAKLQRHLQLLA